MIFGFGWAVWLAWLLAAFFLVNAVVNAINPPPMREAWARWGYPPWFHWVNAAMELVAGVALLFPATRLLGLAVGAAICVGIFATLVRHRELGHVAPGAILFAAILACAAGLAPG